MGSLAFIVSGIEQSEESKIYQFRAATPAEVQAADQEGLEVPGRFRFEQVIDPESGFADGEQLYIELGIAIDPYGCVTIPTRAIANIVDGSAGALPILVTKPGEDDPFIGTIQLVDVTPSPGPAKDEVKADDPEPVLATKVGDMVVFSDEII